MDAGENQVPTRGLRVLSLDGGGVRGLSTLMILEYLMKSIDYQNPPKPCEVFDLIGGTSTGGLIAIMLGRLHMTVKDAIDEYINLSRTVFAPQHRFNFLAKAINTTKARGKCDSTRLEKEIQGVVEKTLGAGQGNALLVEEEPVCRSFVCAIRAEKRSLAKFRNYHQEGEVDLEAKIWQAARATSAATTFFDPAKIGKYGQEFVDGGAGYNCPVREVYEEAGLCWHHPPRDFQCVVSIGTGKGSLKPFGKNLIEVGRTLLDMATKTDEIAAQFEVDHPELMGDGAARRFFRFQVQHGLEKVGMGEHDKINEIASATQIYMQQREQEGCKQLQLFKTMMSNNPNPVTYSISSVALQPEQVRHIERFEKALGYWAPRFLTPLGRRDYSCGTLQLPTTLFNDTQHHCFKYREALDSGEAWSLPTETVWRTVIGRYNQEPANTLREFPVHEAIWYPEQGGAFAIEISVVDIWRIIASFNSNYYTGTVEPNTNTEVHILDLWIRVAGTFHGKPLVHLALRKGTIYSVPETLNIMSHEQAAAMCGIAALKPNEFSDRKVFSSSAKDWDEIKVPLVLAFTLMPGGNRCFFTEQYTWLSKHAASMLRVCERLWEHADAIDLDEKDVPIKIRLRQLSRVLNITHDRAVPQSSYRTDYQFDNLNAAAQRYLNTSPEFNEPGYFVELEDAVQLLERSTSYKRSDFEPSNDDGESEVLHDWWGRFGEHRARWIALAMTAKILLNLCQSMTVPENFTPLLHSPSGTCYVV